MIQLRGRTMAAKKESKRVNPLNLVMHSNVYDIRAELMSPIAKGESALVHVLLQVAPVDMLGQAVGHVVLSLHFDIGQLPSSDLLLRPQLSHLDTSKSPNSSH